jgi:hypothetical protein
MALTLDEAQTLRDAWKAAELAVAAGQSYTIAGRSLTRADARYIHQQFVRYDQVVDQLKAGTSPGVPVFRAMPRDL